MFFSSFRFAFCFLLTLGLLLVGCSEGGEIEAVGGAALAADESPVPDLAVDQGSDGAAAAEAKKTGDDRDPNKKPPKPEFEDKSGPKDKEPGAGPNREDERKWVSKASVKLRRNLDVAATIGDAVCCGDSKAPHDGSPVRIYLAPLKDAPLEGYVLFLGASDHVVLMGQKKNPGVYDRAVYRSTTPALRDKDGGVTLSVPSSNLPSGDLKAWAGVQAPVTIAGVLLGGQEDRPSAKKEDPDTPKPKKDVPVPTKAGKGGSGGQPEAIPFVTLKR
jgi:hypothetical protein